MYISPFNFSHPSGRPYNTLDEGGKNARTNILPSVLAYLPSLFHLRFVDELNPQCICISQSPVAITLYDLNQYAQQDSKS